MPEPGRWHNNSANAAPLPTAAGRASFNACSTSSSGAPCGASSQSGACRTPRAGPRPSCTFASTHSEGRCFPSTSWTEDFGDGSSRSVRPGRSRRRRPAVRGRGRAPTLGTPPPPHPRLLGLGTTAALRGMPSRFWSAVASTAVRRLPAAQSRARDRRGARPGPAQVWTAVAPRVPTSTNPCPRLLSPGGPVPRAAGQLHCT